MQERGKSKDKIKINRITRKIKENRGITLVALVVTIIVLIILSTISISALFGDNGVLRQSKIMKETTVNSTKQDEQEMQELLKEYNNMMQLESFPNEVNNDEEQGTTNTSDTNTTTDPEPSEPEGPPEVTADTPVGTEVKAPSDWTSTQVTPISDGSGHAIPLPNRFYYVGGDRSTGLVISDNSADEGKGTSYAVADTLQGNQYVWIPVDSESDLTRTLFNTSGQPITGLSTSYTEPYASGYSTETSEYNTMKTQVLLYGGFYIGRYEAGDGTNGKTLRTGTTTVHTVVSKKGVAPYNYVPWGTSISDIGTTGAVYLAKNVATQEGYTSVTSTLTYGCQWDAMCRYIGDSGRTTPTKSAPQLTGSVSTDVSKNIYDLAGNCYEWTMEVDALTSTSYRISRGGYYTMNNAIYYRSDCSPTSQHGGYVFRISLYIK